ncbi:EI24 domain-containing protein [Qipengyuania thermophila]|uniref:EI24 domain-containing protein n=1 Tax=Qipengyuania thermophila TaxID=2509361 RepID=UPI001F38724F|nr:EI24 domain-containing protein [Qipengyuania thermophila]
MSLPRALLLAVAQLGDRRVVAVLVKVAALTVLAFAALGVAVAAGFGWLLDRVQMPLAREAGALLGLAAAVLGGWVLFRIVALAVMQFFAEDVVRAVEGRHYPAIAARMRPLPLGRELAQAMRASSRALAANGIVLVPALLLVPTAIGPALLFGLVNAALLGRELQDMVWLRHPDHAAGTHPIPARMRFALGAVIALLLLVPVAGLLAPVIGAAAATHLVHQSRFRGAR